MSDQVRVSADPSRGSVQTRTFHQLAVLIFTFLTITALLSMKLLPPDVSSVGVGSIAPRDIEAPASIEVVDEAATAQAGDQAEQSVSTVYTRNNNVQHDIGLRLDDIFKKVLEVQVSSDPDEHAKLKHDLPKKLPIDLSYDTINTLLSLKDPAQLQALEKQLQATLAVIESNPIPEYSVQEAREHAEQVVREKNTGDARVVNAMADIARKLVMPNVVADFDATNKAKREKRQHVEPIKRYIKKGQMIVRRGDLVTADQMAVLDALGLHKQAINVWGMLANALFVCLALFVVCIYLIQEDSRIPAEPRQMWLLGLIVVFVLAMSRGGIQENNNLTPIATASMLIAILLEYRLSLLVTAMLALCVGIMTGEFGCCAASMVTGLVAVLAVKHVSRRGDLMVASLVIWLVNMLCLVVLSLWKADSAMDIGYNTALFGTLNGLTSSVIAIGALPFLENIFMVTTNIKLLELSNPVEPLLQRLMTEAPGTYHHSMIVANLAESAARSIGADALLAKVGAFYHDVGKMKAASFFVENQLGQENPHDRLTPTLSAHIIINHVRDGMEMARSARLPQVVADFIDMHHGDRLVSYFYHKARERGEAVSESEFRYHGRRPRTRETAIVMLADTIEAKARLLPKPDQENLEKMVRESIKFIMDDGQLDDSALSLRDMQTIQRAFVKTLMGIYHSRIEYPKPPGTEEPATGAATAPEPPASIPPADPQATVSEPDGKPAGSVPPVR
jgi:putative nucleotidyltransferase with HDIG domain